MGTLEYILIGVCGLLLGGNLISINALVKKMADIELMLANSYVKKIDLDVMDTKNMNAHENQWKEYRRLDGLVQRMVGKIYNGKALKIEK